VTINLTVSPGEWEYLLLLVTTNLRGGSRKKKRAHLKRRLSYPKELKIRKEKRSHLATFNKVGATENLVLDRKHLESREKS